MVMFFYGNGSAFLARVLLIVCLMGGSASVMAAWKQALEQAAQSTAEIELFSIVGSNTVGEKLAPALVAGFLKSRGFSDVVVKSAAEVHSRKVTARLDGTEHGIVVSVPVIAKGSSTGFKALASGGADLGASSRPIREEEVMSLSALGDMLSLENEHIVAIDGLAIIVHRDNPLAQLPLQSVRDIFSGKLSNWSQLGGRDGVIKLHARDDNSGTFDTFKRLVLSGASLSRTSRRYESNDDLTAAVNSDINAVGFVALPSIGSAKALAVSDGVALPLIPSELTVATEDYPLSRRLYFYTPAAAKRKPVVSDFLAFVHSNAGQSIVARTGYVAQALYAMSLDAADGRLTGLLRLNLNIRFEDGSSALDNKSKLDVQRLAAFLAAAEHRESRITLVGFSNPVTGASQSSLSRLRAQNVRWALRAEGIRHNISALAGSAVAVSDPDSPNGHHNRRVEVWIQQ